MNLSQSDISRQIPYYLSQPQKEGLVKALNDFPNCNYYTSQGPADALQGDGWTQMELVRFEDGERRKVPGILLSNSCDMSSENKRSTPPLLTFAPLISLAKYRRLLETRGQTATQIEDKFKQIRLQLLTSVFYLPAGTQVKEEYIALLDDVYTLPVSFFQAQTEKTRLFTLSDVAFYLFIMKLSIHFCRMHEAVARG